MISYKDYADKVEVSDVNTRKQELTRLKEEIERLKDFIAKMGRTPEEGEG